MDVVTGAVDTAGTMAGGKATELTCAGTGEDGTHCYRGAVRPPVGGPSGYAVRVTPSHPALSSPYETGLVLWAEG